MSNYPKYFFTTAIAENGDRIIPPATSQEAGTGYLSQDKGWGEVNSMSLSEGGIPPKRQDFNGVLYMLSQFLVWYQQGGILNFSSSFDYEVGNEILYNGVKYRCVKENGVSSTVVVPGSDRNYWRNIDVNVPAGAVVAFTNVTLGGDENRNPIFQGTSQADTGWLLCDGGSDGSDGKVPDLIDRFVRGSTVDKIGTTGGSDSVSGGDLNLSGTVGATTLTLSQIPSHSHSGTCDSAGAHTHTRGTMEITGAHGMLQSNVTASGAFKQAGDGSCTENIATGSSSNGTITFTASNSWTGSTSSSGSHTHTITGTSAGGDGSHTHTLTLSGSTETIDTVPKYYSLAYFVKLPE